MLTLSSHAAGLIRQMKTEDDGSILTRVGSFSLEVEKSEL